MSNAGDAELAAINLRVPRPWL